MVKLLVLGNSYGVAVSEDNITNVYEIVIRVNIMILTLKKICREVLQWILAVFIAILVVSTVCYIYFRPTGWLEREHNATSAIWEPSSIIIKGYEGFGITNVDSNGYTNPLVDVSQENLILCMGASYTQGKEVMQDKTYVSLLNSMITGGTNDKLHVYNLSKDAFFYPEIAAGVKAAIDEFPQTSTLILEIGNTDFSNDILEKALSERTYEINECGVNLYNQLSKIGKTIMLGKDFFPIYSVLKNQVSLLRSFDDSLEKQEDKYDVEHNKKLIDETLCQIRNAFDGQIIVLYHPATNLYPDGSMRLEYSNNYEIFSQLCKENNLYLIDLGDDFLDAYENGYYVPYGFNNTTIGQGHFNENGHRIIANRLYSVITIGE